MKDFDLLRAVLWIVGVIMFFLALAGIAYILPDWPPFTPLQRALLMLGGSV